MHTESPERSARYLRRSKKKTAAEKSSDLNTLSVEDQRKRTSALEAQYHYKHVREFVDDGVTAWREDVERGDFNALCEYIATGAVDVVVTDAPDRLSRQGGRAYLAFRDLCRDNGVKIHTVSQGLDECADDFNEIPAYLSGFLAKRESTEKSRRLRNYVTERAAEGKPRRAGVRPFGWQDDKVTLHPVESALIREAVAHVLNGGAVGKIIREWNEAGVLSTRGKPWSRSAVKAVLLRERNAGLMRLRGEVLPDVTPEWEAIITPEQWRELVVMLGPQGGAAPEGRHLLSGLMKCHCGQPLRASTGGRRGQVYRCATMTEYAAKKAVPHVSITRAEADPYITAELVSALLVAPDDALPQDGDTMTLGTLYAALSDVETQRANLLRAVMLGAFTDAQVKSQAAELDAEEERLQARIESLVTSNAKAGLISQLRRELWSGTTVSFEDAAKVKAELRERFEAMPLDDKRALIRAYLDITVYPGRGTERVDAQHLVATSLSEQEPA